MAQSIASWIATAFIEHDNKFGADLVSPWVGSKYCQVVKFTTYRTPETPHAQVRAIISDRIHTIPVAFDVAATDKFETYVPNILKRSLLSTETWDGEAGHTIFARAHITPRPLADEPPEPLTSHLRSVFRIKSFTFHLDSPQSLKREACDKDDAVSLPRFSFVIQDWEVIGGDRSTPVVFTQAQPLYRTLGSASVQLDSTLRAVRDVLRKWWFGISNSVPSPHSQDPSPPDERPGVHPPLPKDPPPGDSKPCLDVASRTMQRQSSAFIGREQSHQRTPAPSEPESSRTGQVEDDEDAALPPARRWLKYFHHLNPRPGEHGKRHNPGPEEVWMPLPKVGLDEVTFFGLGGVDDNVASTEMAQKEGTDLSQTSQPNQGRGVSENHADGLAVIPPHVPQTAKVTPSSPKQVHQAARMSIANSPEGHLPSSSDDEDDMPVKPVGKTSVRPNRAGFGSEHENAPAAEEAALGVVPRKTTPQPVDPGCHVNEINNNNAVEADAEDDSDPDSVSDRSSELSDYEREQRRRARVSSGRVQRRQPEPSGQLNSDLVEEPVITAGESQSAHPSRHVTNGSSTVQAQGLLPTRSQPMTEAHSSQPTDLRSSSTTQAPAGQRVVTQQSRQTRSSQVSADKERSSQTSAAAQGNDDPDSSFSLSQSQESVAFRLTGYGYSDDSPMTTRTPQQLHRYSGETKEGALPHMTQLHPPQILHVHPNSWPHTHPGIAHTPDVPQSDAPPANRSSSLNHSGAKHLTKEKKKPRPSIESESLSQSPSGPDKLARAKAKVLVVSTTDESLESSQSLEKALPQASAAHQRGDLLGEQEPAPGAQADKSVPTPQSGIKSELDPDHPPPLQDMSRHQSRQRQYSASSPAPLTTPRRSQAHTSGPSTPFATQAVPAGQRFRRHLDREPEDDYGVEEGNEADEEAEEEEEDGEEVEMIEREREEAKPGFARTRRRSRTIEFRPLKRRRSREARGTDFVSDDDAEAVKVEEQESDPEPDKVVVSVKLEEDDLLADEYDWETNWAVNLETPVEWAPVTSPNLWPGPSRAGRVVGKARFASRQFHEKALESARRERARMDAKNAERARRRSSVAGNTSFGG